MKNSRNGKPELQKSAHYDHKKRKKSRIPAVPGHGSICECMDKSLLAGGGLRAVVSPRVI